MTDWQNRVHVGSADAMTAIPDESVHCCVTSPPYLGLRDYGVDGQIGLEGDLKQYLARLVDVFREVRRVLRPDGTLWVNMGDAYDPGFTSRRSAPNGSSLGSWKENFRNGGAGRIRSGLKPKDLMMQAARLAIALQDDGWWLRDDIIWVKPNPHPSSADDRCTPAYEHIFMLSKSRRYFADMHAVRTPFRRGAPAFAISGWAHEGSDHSAIAHASKTREERYAQKRGAEERVQHEYEPHGGANLRNVWTIATVSYPEAHFATFPPEIPTRCIKIGTSERGVCPECGAPWRRLVERRQEKAGNSGALGTKIVGKGAGGTQVREDHDVRDGPIVEIKTVGWAHPWCQHRNLEPVPAIVLDPFMGSGTTADAALRLGRDWVGYEINPEYAALVDQRPAVRERALYEQAMSGRVG